MALEADGWSGRSMRQEMFSRLDVRIGRRDLIKRLLAGTWASLLTGCGVQRTSRASTGSGTAEWTRLQARVQGQVLARGGADYEIGRRSIVLGGVKPERFPEIGRAHV